MRRENVEKVQREGFEPSFVTGVALVISLCRAPSTSAAFLEPRGTMGAYSPPRDPLEPYDRLSDSCQKPLDSFLEASENVLVAL